MCWSLSASVGAATFAAAASVVARRKGLPTAVWVVLAYFSLMEVLQALGYLVINACGAPANQAITLLSYFHIMFQPLAINALSLELIPHGVRERIRFWVFAVCGVCAALMLAQLMPFDWAGMCRIGESMCGRTLCTRAGDWHIAWDVPYNGIGTWVEDALGGQNWGMPFYMFGVFVVPLIYGTWRFTLFNLMLGPVFANMITTDNNEAPAIWCLFAGGLITFAYFPAMVEWFRVRSWPLWPASWTHPEASDARAPNELTRAT